MPLCSAPSWWVLLALIVPCIGIIVVLKRLSMIGDALSHTSLAGVAGGLLWGLTLYLVLW